MSVRPLPFELQERAKIELNEFPERLQEDVQKIKDWLTRQPHLNARLDNQWLVSFLRASKFSLQRTKERIDRFYMMRTLAPEFFTNRDPFLDNIQDIFQRGFCIPLGAFERGGNFYTLIRWKAVSPDRNPFVDLIKVLFMLGDVILQEDDHFGVAGVETIIDAEDYPFNYTFQQTPALCKKLITILENAYPVRLKMVHCINVPPYFGVIFNLFRPYLSEKLQNRIELYNKNEFDRFQQKVPLYILPKEYGSSNKPASDIAAIWKKTVEDCKEWFEEDSQYTSDESKRPGKPKTSTEVFGMEGSFRKLEVD